MSIIYCFNEDPGNILVDVSQKGGRPVLLDFGLAKHLSISKRLAFCKLVVSAASFDYGGLIDSFDALGIKMNRFDSKNDLDVVRFAFRDTAPPKEAKKQARAFGRVMRKRRLARKRLKLRAPINSFPGDLLFFFRALDLLRGLCSRLEVIQKPLEILSISARQALEDATKTFGANNHVESCQEVATSRLQASVEKLLCKISAEEDILGIQVAVCDSEANFVVDTVVGCLGPHDRRAVQSDSLFNCFSVTKGYCTFALLILADEGLIEFDRPVCEYWPEFRSKTITVSQLASHRAGMEAEFPSDMSLDVLCDWKKMTEHLASVESKPVEDAKYHAINWGFLVGGLVEAVTGIRFQVFLRRRIAEPLGLQDDLLVGIPKLWALPLWSKEHTKESIKNARRLATLDATSLLDSRNEGAGMSASQQQKIIDDMTEKLNIKEDTLEDILFLSDPRIFNCARVRCACIPAANGHSNARGLAKLFSSTLPTYSLSNRILSEHMVQEASNIISVETSNKRQTNFGLGWQIFEMNNGCKGFGHRGFGGSIALAIPSAGVSVAVVTNKLRLTNMVTERILNHILKEFGLGEIRN